MNTEYNKGTTPPASNPMPENKGRMIGGAIVVVVGAVLLLHRSGVEMPGWLLSWPMIPILIGFYVGARSRFQGWNWAIPIAIGGFFLVGHILKDFSFDHYFWPIIIITVGLIMIFKPRRNPEDWKFWDETKNGGHRKSNPDVTIGPSSTTSSDADYIEGVTIFGGSKKVIISKNFRGGEAITFFGGTEINMSQADIQGRIQLEVVQVFGGAKLVVPSNWRVVHEEVVCVFGGIDDKRNPAILSPDADKVLILKGMCLFGGIDIKSY